MEGSEGVPKDVANAGIKPNPYAPPETPEAAKPLPEVVPKENSRESVKAELEILTTTVDKLSSILPTIQQPPDDDEIPKNEAQPVPQVKPASPEELKTRLKQIPGELEQKVKDFMEPLREIDVRLVLDVKHSPLNSPEDAQKVNDLLDNIISKVQQSKDEGTKLGSLYEDYKIGQEQYEQLIYEQASKILGREIKSSDDLRAVYNENALQAGGLARERFGLGKITHRAEIAKVWQHGAQVWPIFDQLHEVPYDPGYQLSNSVLQESPRALEKTTTEVGEVVIQKILARYDQLLPEASAGDLESQQELPEILTQALDNEFVNKYFTAYVQSTLELARESSQYSLEHYYAQAVKDLSDLGNIKIAADIIRESLSIAHYRDFSTQAWRYHGTERTPDEIKSEELHARVQQLPRSIQELILTFHGRDVRYWEKTRDLYKKMAGFVQGASGVEERTELVESQKQLLHELEYVISYASSYELNKKYSPHIRERFNQIPNPPEELREFVENFATEIDPRLWELFISNPDAQSYFGKERLEEANQYLIRLLWQRLLTQPAGSNTAVSLSFRLIELRTPETVPLMLLNAYRESGIFTNFHQYGQPENAPLNKFVRSLTQEDLDKLAKQNVPGVLELIDLIKNNPSSIMPNSREYYDIATGESVENTAYKQIEQRIFQLGLHYLEKGDENMGNFVMGVFDCFDHEAVLTMLASLQTERGQFPQAFSDNLLIHLRQSDPLMRGPFHVSELSSEAYDHFYKGLGTLLKEMFDPQGKLINHREYFLNDDLLKFVARQPERVGEIMEIPTSAPYLFDVLLKPGGPLHTNKGQIIDNIFANGNALKRAKEVESIFSRKVPYWKQLYLFTDARIGESLAAANSEYPITEIAGVSLESLLSRHQLSKQQNPDKITRLEAIVKDPQILAKLESGEIHEIPFSSINGTYKRVIFRDLLRTTIETSRKGEVKAQADERNKASVVNPLAFTEGTYIHGSAVDVLESVLLNGNLPREALGEGAWTDSFPFHTDFSRITAPMLKPEATIDEIIESTISKTYGQGGSMGIEGQLFYIYQRNPGTYEGGKVFGPNETHSLILGGMPATEISGIVLRNPDRIFDRVRRSVLENGFYIPIYRLNGELLFTPEEYDQERQNFNLDIPTAVWDYSLKTGEQLGSNPGGQFAVPTERGPRPFYVKFASAEGTDQIWNEQLADNIYRHLGISVPNTQIVKVEGSYGHASEMLPLDQQVGTTELKNGFIFDALLANWDIVANTGNVVSSGGRLIRIDNGGSLLFRARGDRKTEFTGIVTELESMRASYPGLTSEDVQSQLGVLRERFTDQAIEQLVDSVRLSTNDRSTLKATLRERRDYILGYYGGFEQETPREVSEQGKMVESELRIDELNDTTIAQLVPEWTKLTGEEGYQHNGVLLGQHIKDAVAALKYLPEYWSLNEKEKSLALISTLFHDMGKPTGRQGSEVSRDFEHEIPSAQIAANYMQRWGYSDADIQTVIQVIVNDGIVSDIARGKIRGETKNLTPQQLRKTLRNTSTLKILRAVNRADVIGTVGSQGFSAIEQAYNQFFNQAEQSE